MNVENHIYNSKICLDFANYKVSKRDFNTALAMLVEAYSNIRKIMDHVLALKAEQSELERSESNESP